MNDEYAPGDRVKWIVGMPGIDLDEATIVTRNADGAYTVRYQVYGKGLWHEGVAHIGGPASICRIVCRVEEKQ